MIERPNILIDPLPETVIISGIELPIETGFRTGMLVEMAIYSGELTEQELLDRVLRLYYSDEVLAIISRLDHPEEAFHAALWFYSCGKKNRKANNRAEGKAKRPGIAARAYDFEVDAPLIYAAFLDQYRIDLNEIETLHWWKFAALFSALDERHLISKIMTYRTTKLSDIKDKKRRQQIAELQAKFALPDNRPKEEKAAAIGAVFGGLSS
ncbi:MAG: bacteriophage Gp15 family protein [Clostridia bacterium]|nr:bacteriophage Gp15 family protein [Clostridia bacterium]